MALVLLTRILLMAYGLGCLAAFIVMMANMATGKKFKGTDVGTVLLWPLLVLTIPGRDRLANSLTGE